MARIMAHSWDCVPTGKLIAMTGMEIFRIENGRIADLWGEANLLGLMQQLGILPLLGR